MTFFACADCGGGYPTVATQVYYSATGATRLCDECLFRGMPEEATTTVYAGGWESEALGQARMAFGLTEDTA